MPDASGRRQTPMERDYPTICEWVRHGGVRTDDLVRELKAALGWLSDGTVWIDRSQPSLGRVSPVANATRSQPC